MPVDRPRSADRLSGFVGRHRNGRGVTRVHVHNDDPMTQGSRRAVSSMFQGLRGLTPIRLCSGERPGPPARRVFRLSRRPASGQVLHRHFKCPGRVAEQSGEPWIYTPCRPTVRAQRIASPGLSDGIAIALEFCWLSCPSSGARHFNPQRTCFRSSRNTLVPPPATLHGSTGPHENECSPRRSPAHTTCT